MLFGSLWPMVKAMFYEKLKCAIGSIEVNR